MEYLDEVNEKNERTGKIYEKDEFHNKGLWYREVIGIIMNTNNEVLLQKRSPNKKTSQIYGKYVLDIFLVEKLQKLQFYEK